MGLTVRQLTEMPQLRTWIHAGAAGAEREVNWAHVCELPEPWEWLSGGELLMTIGLGVPARADGQVAYVERLADAGASALTIAERLHAPALTAAMLEAAERLAFPILFTGYEIPFIAIERAVADASRQAGQERLTRMLRLYETVRRAAVEGLAGAALVDRLAAAAGCRAFVVDPARGSPLLPGAVEPPPGLAAALAAAVAARSHPLPAVLRLSSSAEQGLALPVPARRPASLLVLPDAGGRSDPAVLEHVATIAALELEKLAAERERDRRLGAELLAGLVDGRLPADASDQLSARSLHGDLVLVACARPDGAVEHRDLHHRLGERGVPHLLLHRGGTLLVLVAAGRATLAALVRAIGAGALAGVSNPFDRPSRAADAAREARWALEGARSTGEPVVRYGERALSPFMPRTVSEAQAIVGRVLGPLQDYDSAHGTDLLGSLAAFLTANRSWQRAAAALRVHKQTLVYRMRRVEELTGRRLDRTEDVAELWLALRTREAAGADLVQAD